MHTSVLAFDYNLRHSPPGTSYGVQVSTSTFIPLSCLMDLYTCSVVTPTTRLWVTRPPPNATARLSLHMTLVSGAHTHAHAHTHTHIHTHTHTRTHLLFHSITLSLTHSLTHSLIHSLTHSLTHSLPLSLTISLTHSLTHSLPSSLTLSLTHSQLHLRHTYLLTIPEHHVLEV